MSLRRLIRDVVEAGYIEVRQRGSHKVFKHVSGMSLVVPVKDGDAIRPGTEKNIRKNMARKSNKP